MSRDAPTPASGAMRAFALSPLRDETLPLAADAARRGAADPTALARVTVNGSRHAVQQHDIPTRRVATMVRMLMRDQLDHEAVCTLGRDRILWLADEVERLDELLHVIAAQTDPAWARQIATDALGDEPVDVAQMLVNLLEPKGERPLGGEAAADWDARKDIADRIRLLLTALP